MSGHWLLVINEDTGVDEVHKENMRHKKALHAEWRSISFKGQ